MILKFFSTIIYALVIALIIGVAGLLLGSMLPIPGNIEIKIVKSGSMEPDITTGSIVVVKPSSAYRFGDVITFGRDTKTEVPTTHRIIGVHGEGAVMTYTTKGDANEEADPQQVARRDVIGKVIFSLPYAGYVLDFARQPIGFALLIAVPAGLVILEEVLTIFKETRKWMRRKDDEDEEGGSPAPTLGAHLKKVYVRRHRMDEIFVPRVVARSHFAQFLHSDAYGTSTALVLGLVFMSSVFSGASGGTIAYFQDIERSIGNIFQAGVWEPKIEEVVLPSEDLSLFSLSALSEGSVLGESDAPCEGDDCPPEEEETSPESVPESADSGTPPPAPEEPPAEPENDAPASVVTPDEDQTAPIDPQAGSTPPEDPAAQTAPNEPSEAENSPPEPPAETSPSEPPPSPPPAESPSVDAVAQ